jgi:phenylacetate-CoA ligase
VEVEMLPTGPTDDDARSRKAAEVSHRIKSLIGVSCDVTVKAPGEVPRSEGKAVRVKDFRNKPKAP